MDPDDAQARLAPINSLSTDFQIYLDHEVESGAIPLKLLALMGKSSLKEFLVHDRDSALHLTYVFSLRMGLMSLMSSQKGTAAMEKSDLKHENYSCCRRSLSCRL